MVNFLVFMLNAKDKIINLLPKEKGKFTFEYNINFYSVTMLFLILVVNKFTLHSWWAVLLVFLLFIRQLSLVRESDKKEQIIAAIKKQLTEIEVNEFKKDLPVEMQHLQLSDFNCEVKTVTIIESEKTTSVRSFITIISDSYNDEDDDDDEYENVDDDGSGGSGNYYS